MCVRYEPLKTIQYTFRSSGDSYFALSDFPWVSFIDDDVNFKRDERDESSLIMITMRMVMMWKIKKAA